MKNHIRIWQRALFALGLSLCLTGAFLMVDGNIFGERTTGIATVVGIFGIGLISTFTTRLGLKSAKESQKKTKIAISSKEMMA